MKEPTREIHLDFETFWDSDYTLRRMTTPAYIFDSRFENIMCAVAEGDAEPYIVDGADFEAWVRDAEPTRDDTATVTFNALFDQSILAWRYGYIPRRMIDTMGVARALLGHKLSSFSLENVAAYLKLGVKDKAALIQTKGMHRHDMKRLGLWDKLCTYAKHDVTMSRGILRVLGQRFPASERRVMDLVLRACVDVKFIADRKLLCDHIEKIRKDKYALLQASGVGVGELMSSAKFVNELMKLGVEIEYKDNANGDKIPAIAKTDQFMEDLSEHDDPTVQALAAARIGHKSTLEETRALTLLSVANLPWLGGVPSMPIPLKYGAAHTHRLGGEWKMNMQNLPRGGNLRKSLLAPPGYKVVVADLGQIEARLVAWICGELELLQQFRDGIDPYCAMASKIFDRIVTILDKVERFIGKGAILGLGYQMAAPKFYISTIRTARTQKIALGDMWTLALAEKSVATYRTSNPNIKRGWQFLDRAVRGAWLDQNQPAVAFGPAVISHGRVDLPSGLSLLYGDPRVTKEIDKFGRPNYLYTFGRESHYMYGAKLLENIVQALARIIVMHAALRLETYGLRFQMQAHDELAYIVPDAAVDSVKELVHREMTRPPSWAPDLPLTADVKAGQSYGEAK